MNFKPTLFPVKGLIAGLLLTTLAACGGGGSSGGGSTGTSVSGKATAPGGSVAHFESHSLIRMAGDFLLPAAQAEITGLQAVPGATVELITVNDDGNQVGDVLASTQTSITGDYQLVLPAGLNFAANLVLRITSADRSQTLDAQVLQQAVNIDPYSDFLLDKLVENGTQLANLPVNEALVLKGQLEEFDLTAGSDLSAMLAALEEATGEFMDNSIQTVNNGEGDAATVAGDYHFGEFSFSLHDSDSNSSGTFSAELVQESLALIAKQGGELTATFDNTRLDSFFNLQYIQDQSSNLWVQNTIENFPESEDALVDGAGALVFEIDFEEELQDCDDPNPELNCFGWRSPASTVRLDAVGQTGLFLGRFIEASVRYHQTAEGTLDPTRKAGDEVFYTLAMAAKKGTQQSAATLTGSYGIVGIEAEAHNVSGFTQLDGFYGVENLDGAGNATETLFDSYLLSRNSNSAPIPSTDNVTEPFTYAVTPEGTITFPGDDSSDIGFVINNGSGFAVLSHGSDASEENPGTLDSAYNGMTFGLKLPESTPTMSGKQYQLYNLMFGYGTTDTALSSLTNGVLTFNSGSTVTLTADKSRLLERPNDTSDLSSTVETLGTLAENTATTINNNGMFSTNLQLIDGSQLILDGFISAATDMIVFRAKYLEGSDTKEIGLYIGSLKSE